MTAETSPPARRRRGRWRLLASPLTRRILLVNLLAPVVLVAGLLYLDRYKQGLIRAELDGLGTQAEMVAGAIGEGAVFEEEAGFFEVNPDMAQQMVRRLSEPAKFRARLFGAVGELAADSRIVGGAKGRIYIEELPPPNPTHWTSWPSRLWDRWSRWMPRDKTLPLYQDRMEARAGDFDEVLSALSGNMAWAVRSRPSGQLVLSVAVPVQRYKQVVGALLITADGTTIARSLFQVRVAILEAFLVSLALTIAVSLYMAATIARPVRRLALAAERVRHGQGRVHAIPDLSGRKDEIGELSVALKEMTEALWRRMDAIEAFAADVAHEIKNPLSSLRSAVETAARISDPEKRARLMAIVQEDVGRLDRLISDISDASRVDAEMSRAETAPVSLSEMAATLGEIYGSTCGEQGLCILVERPGDDALMVQGMESRLVQVLRNLLANAISFSPAGGTIRLAVRRDGQEIRISVEDEGPGIPEGKLEAVFERFYSERPEGEKFGTHSGLGLSISRQIAEAHGGRLWAENRQERGARFTLALTALP